MRGWKTKSAGFLAIGYGILGFVLSIHDLDTGANFVVQGLGILGIGHKIEKLGS